MLSGSECVLLVIYYPSDVMQWTGASLSELSPSGLSPCPIRKVVW